VPVPKPDEQNRGCTQDRLSALERSSPTLRRAFRKSPPVHTPVYPGVSPGDAPLGPQACLRGDRKAHKRLRWMNTRPIRPGSGYGRRGGPSPVPSANCSLLPADSASPRHHRLLHRWESRRVESVESHTAEGPIWASLADRSVPMSVTSEGEDTAWRIEVSLSGPTTWLAACETWVLWTWESRPRAADDGLSRDDDLADGLRLDACDLRPGTDKVNAGLQMGSPPPHHVKGRRAWRQAADDSLVRLEV